MHTPIPDHKTTIFRLTALWALCESGLGGWMHALGLPFTGFFVGGFAVVVIGLIAWYSGRNMRLVIQATFLVILVKAAVSPHSPPPAYIAVAFQGLIGALFFRFIPSFSWAAILFCVVAMLESALQGVLTATIIFGNSLWDAIDRFFRGLLQDLRLPADTPYSLWIILVYAAVYAGWGIVLGIWIRRLPQKIDAGRRQIIDELKELPTGAGLQKAPAAKSPLRKIALTAFILVFIVAVLLANTGSSQQALWVIIRTFAVLAFFVWVLNPLVRLLLQWMLRRSGEKRFARVQGIIALLPELRNHISPAYALARRQKGLSRFRRFLFILIVLTIHPDLAEQ